jgi:hypothetical protein
MATLEEVRAAIARKQAQQQAGPTLEEVRAAIARKQAEQQAMQQAPVMQPQQAEQQAMQPQQAAILGSPLAKGDYYESDAGGNNIVANVDSGVQPIGAAIGREIAGGLEAGGQIVAGAVAEPIAGLAGLITAPFVGNKEAAENIEAVRSAIGGAIDVETPEGKRNLNAIIGLVNKGVDLARFPISGLVGIGEILSGQGLEQAAKSVAKVQQEGVSTALGQRVFDATGDPALAAIAHSLPTAALEILGVKGLKSTKLAHERLSGNIAKAIRQSAPDIDTIKQRKKAAYKELDDLGVRVKADVFDSFANNLQKKLKKEGLDKTLHPKASAALNRILDDAGRSKRISEIETLRKIANDAARSIDAPEARLGSIIVDEIDRGLDVLSEQIGGKAKEARALAQRGFKSQTITDMIENASHTASGMENGLRIEARKILKSKKKRRGLTADELGALKQIEQGTTAANMAKFLGKFGISEGQATSMLGASIGAGGGGAIGSMFGPGGAAVGAVAVPALGQFAKKTAQRITMNNTRFADDLVRSGKNAKAIAKAYLKYTPVSDRRVSDLTDLLLDADISPSKIKGLPSSKTVSGKLIADSIFFAKEARRRAKQTGSAVLMASPELQEQE